MILHSSESLEKCVKTLIVEGERIPNERINKNYWHLGIIHFVPPDTHTYARVRKVIFTENFVYVLNELKIIQPIDANKVHRCFKKIKTENAKRILKKLRYFKTNAKRMLNILEIPQIWQFPKLLGKWEQCSNKISEKMWLRVTVISVL